MNAGMTITTFGGGRHLAEITAPLGNPAKPMNLDACKEKFHKCLRLSGLAMDSTRVDEFLGLVERLDECPDVAQLPALLR